MTFNRHGGYCQLIIKDNGTPACLISFKEVFTERYMQTLAVRVSTLYNVWKTHGDIYLWKTFEEDVNEIEQVDYIKNLLGAMEINITNNSEEE